MTQLAKRPSEAGTTGSRHAARLACPVTGCRSKHKPEQILCAGHWYQVPAHLRERIWHLYRTERGSLAHRAAIREAIRAVNELQRSTPPRPAA